MCRRHSNDWRAMAVLASWPAHALPAARGPKRPQPKPRQPIGPHGSPAFMATFEKMKAAKAGIARRSMPTCWRSATTWPTSRPQGVKMTRGKAVQGGVRVKLPHGHDLGEAGRA